MTSAGRGYLLTNDKSFLETYRTTVYENEAILAELPQFINNKKQQDLLNQIRDLESLWRGEFALLFNDSTKKRTGSAAHRRLVNNAPVLSVISSDSKVFHALQKTVRDFINEEYKIREEHKLTLAKSIQSTGAISFSLTLFSILTGCIIAAVLARSISRRILNMVQMSNSIARGDYSVHLNDRGSDELSKLSKSLNDMAYMLAESFTLLKRKNEELDQFAHIVSHDLKAPLRGISNVITWIDEDHSHELSPKVHEYLQLINGRLARAENLIKGILSYARIGTEVMVKEKVEVAQMVSEILENTEVPSSVSVVVDKSLPAIYTERLPLFQVLSNLINNAVKYNDKQSGLVIVYSTEQSDHHQFFVEDNGPGIATSHQGKIFKIFQTLQERDSFESTGVGLAIVQKILDARKEKVEIYSDLGKGSTFVFTWKK
jgi:signal transduction histidine kinase